MRTLFAAVFVTFCMASFANPLLAAEYQKAKLDGKPDISSLGCGAGQFWDPRNGGECWSCSGKNRTVFPVTGKKACKKPVSETLKSAALKSTDNLSCAKGSFFDPRNGGECWSCPTGTGRTLTAVTAKNACSKRVGRVNKKAKYSYNTGSILKACKKGTFANVGSTKCYKCSRGYRHNGGKKVNKSGVCYKSAYTKTYKATKKKSLAGLKCPSGQFFDPTKGGSCWSCPKDYNRTAYSVTGGKACSKATSASFSTAKKIKAAKVTALGCGPYGKRSFFDLTKGGSCWSCKSSNPVRTLYPVTSGQACATKTCGKLNGRPCYVTERFPSCNKGLLEDPIKNKCIKAKDLACSATLGIIAKFKQMNDEAQRAGKAVEDAALDAIPGARAFLRFMLNQGEQLKKEQKKLMKKVDTSEIQKQLNNLIGKNPKELKRMAEIAKKMAKAKKKIVKVFLNPKVMCSGSGKTIANALKKTGIENMFAQLEPSLWQQFNPISTADAKTSASHQMSIDLSLNPWPVPPYNKLAVGIGFSTDFKKNHSLTLPSISVGGSASTDDILGLEKDKKSGAVGLSVGWAFDNGHTNWGGRGDPVNWGANIDISILSINFGSVGFSGLSIHLADLAKYEVKEVTDLFSGLTTTTTNKSGPKGAGLSLSAGGGIAFTNSIALK